MSGKSLDRIRRISMGFRLRPQAIRKGDVGNDRTGRGLHKPIQRGPRPRISRNAEISRPSPERPRGEDDEAYESPCKRLFLERYRRCGIVSYRGAILAKKAGNEA